jgi:hypothetical protein
MKAKHDLNPILNQRVCKIWTCNMHIEYGGPGSPLAFPPLKIAFDGSEPIGTSRTEYYLRRPKRWQGWDTGKYTGTASNLASMLRYLLEIRNTKAIHSPTTTPWPLAATHIHTYEAAKRNIYSLKKSHSNRSPWTEQSRSTATSQPYHVLTVYVYNSRSEFIGRLSISILLRFLIFWYLPFNLASHEAKYYFKSIYYSRSRKKEQQMVKDFKVYCKETIITPVWATHKQNTTL